MDRLSIIKELQKYFSVKELVCEHTYKVFGETSWQFLSTALLHTILVVRRDILQVPMSINGTGFTQRGLRCNICQLVKDKTLKGQIYVSAHLTGNAIDFDAKGFTAEQARAKIKEKQALLFFKIRLEDNVNWVHLDVYDDLNPLEKVHLFNA